MVFIYTDVNEIGSFWKVYMSNKRVKKIIQAC